MKNLGKLGGSANTLIRKSITKLRRGQTLKEKNYWKKLFHNNEQTTLRLEAHKIIVRLLFSTINC